MSQGLTFQAAYTYTTIDTSEREQGNYDLRDEPTATSNSALASLMCLSESALPLSMMFPFCALRLWYCRAFGGWNVSAYGVFEKGFPLDVLTNGSPHWRL